MSFGDSAAVFKSRALEIGLAADAFAKFEAEGLVTLASLAFSCHFSPGSADEKPLVDLATKVLGAPPSLKETSCVCRLFAEAYATVGSDVPAQVESTEDSSVKRFLQQKCREHACPG